MVHSTYTWYMSCLPSKGGGTRIGILSDCTACKPKCHDSSGRYGQHVFSEQSSTIFRLGIDYEIWQFKGLARYCCKYWMTSVHQGEHPVSERCLGRLQMSFRGLFLSYSPLLSHSLPLPTRMTASCFLILLSWSFFFRSFVRCLARNAEDWLYSARSPFKA
ncbi:hypothetical protein BU23DRAFT_19965 [Bimuria novae-zelandiae CBS 107.79]|uniref:Uncharacterized protein n=1 Tax=Bimuria novae-zelandiae CBS 107.79 TaxID=1447943 RepID=A0A6A5ULC4_9PLEO|nr:hypothetical protein BU23DRAFT_19965 [Bimuria novae-zelandiae CBS 107.79]